MKKAFFLLIAIIASLSANAQLVEVYRNGFLEKTFTNTTNKDYKVVFKEHREYVEFGGVNWSTKNLGATTVSASLPSSRGDLFAWGEIDTYYSSNPYNWTLKWGKTSELTHIPGLKTAYDWSNYCGTNDFVEWNIRPYGDDLMLKPEYDPAHVKWGEKWRMPNADDIKKLYAACGVTSTSVPVAAPSSIKSGGLYWVTAKSTIDGQIYNVDGALFVATTDISKRLFFPSGGCGADTSMMGPGVFLWTSKAFSKDGALATVFFVNKDEDFNEATMERKYGLPIRPVFN